MLSVQSLEFKSKGLRSGDRGRVAPGNVYAPSSTRLRATVAMRTSEQMKNLAQVQECIIRNNPTLLYKYRCIQVKGLLYAM